MPYYTLSKDLFKNNETRCKVDLLNLFPQTNILKACIDKNGKILDDYKQEVILNNNTFLKDWTDFMRNTDNFIEIEIEETTPIEDVYLEVCLKTQVSQKLILNSFQEVKGVFKENNQYFIKHNDKKISVFDKETGRIEIQKTLNNCEMDSQNIKKGDKKIMNIQTTFGKFPKSTILFIFALFSILYYFTFWDNESESNNNSNNNKSVPKFIVKREKKGLIIFIHGFSGNSIETWKNENSKLSFPELVAKDSTFKNFDVFTHGYISPTTKNGFTISEFADGLRITFQSERLNNYENIIIVSHSMGGLITRAFLERYNADYKLASKIKLLYFYATPTEGSQIANWAKNFSNNPSLAELTEDDGKRILGNYASNWSANSDLRKIPSYCAYENISMASKIIVSKNSAIALSNRVPDPILENHLNIVKPFDNKAICYQVFSNAFLTEKLDKMK